MTIQFIILEVEEDASIKEIKKSYRRLIKLYRPNEYPEKFREIRSAYEYILKVKSSEKVEKTGDLNKKNRNNFNVEEDEENKKELSISGNINYGAIDKVGNNRHELEIVVSDEERLETLLTTNIFEYKNIVEVKNLFLKFDVSYLVHLFRKLVVNKRDYFHLFKIINQVCIEESSYYYLILFFKSTPEYDLLSKNNQFNQSYKHYDKIARFINGELPIKEELLNEQPIELSLQIIELVEARKYLGVDVHYIKIDKVLDLETLKTINKDIEFMKYYLINVSAIIKEGEFFEFYRIARYYCKNDSSNFSKALKILISDPKGNTVEFINIIRQLDFFEFKAIMFYALKLKKINDYLINQDLSKFSHYQYNHYQEVLKIKGRIDAEEKEKKSSAPVVVIIIIIIFVFLTIIGAASRSSSVTITLEQEEIIEELAEINRANQRDQENQEIRRNFDYSICDISKEEAKSKIEEELEDLYRCGIIGRFSYELYVDYLTEGNYIDFRSKIESDLRYESDSNFFLDYEESLCVWQAVEEDENDTSN